MAPIRLIVGGKNRRDQTEDKEAIQIFSYNQSGIFSMLYKTNMGNRLGGFDSEEQASRLPSKCSARV